MLYEGGCWVMKKEAKLHVAKMCMLRCVDLLEQVKSGVSIIRKCMFFWRIFWQDFLMLKISSIGRKLVPRVFEISYSFEGV